MKKLLQWILSTQLRRLGTFISNKPILFIICPCILSAVLGTGMLVMKYERDLGKLAGYDEGRAYKSKILVEKMFPRNTSDYVDIPRIVDASSIVAVSVLNKNGGSVLSKECLLELKTLDEIIKNVSITLNGRTVRYSELCGKVGEHCFKNPLISTLSHKEEILNKRRKIKYPVDIDPNTYSYQLYVANIGGVTLDDNGFVDDAKVFRLFYPTDDSNENKTVMIKNWIDAVLNRVKRISFSHLDVLPFTFSLVTDEVREIANSILPLTAAVIIIIALFSSATSMTSSWITSKPWLGTAACISAGLALISSFGLTFHLGVPTTDFNIGVPFLILGTEVDDAYVLIATWRKTNPNEPVSKRMGDTFAEAGVSITITSITNVTSFCVAIMTPFFGVRYFCIHAAVALAFTYFYMITFFGAFMAVDGFREKKLMNGITLQKCSNRNEEFCHGKEEVVTEIATMKVFKSVIGKYLEKSSVKAIVILLFVINIIAGISGLSYLEDGLELENLLPPTSTTTESITLFHRYFSNYFGSLHIVVNEPLNYADPKVQKSIDELLQNFWSHPKIADPELTASWLRFYKIFQNHILGKFSLGGYNLSVEEDFISGLHNVFLQIPVAREFKYDIAFNENYTKILASRYLLPIIDVASRREQSDLVRDMWRICDKSKFEVAVHSTFFPLIEQAVVIRNIVFQLIWITSLLIFIVFFAFIPSFLTALIVAVSVMSSLVATVGYMAVWGVKLDMISTTVLVLSVGFSVNYPSHVACAFSLATKESGNEKMKESLYHVGLPILQGSLSTILGASILAVKDTYICRTFPKLMFLISLQTAYHAMFVLPVALGIMTDYTKGWSIRNCLHLNCTRQKNKTTIPVKEENS